MIDDNGRNEGGGFTVLGVPAIDSNDVTGMDRAMSGSKGRGPSLRSQTRVTPLSCDHRHLQQNAWWHCRKGPFAAMGTHAPPKSAGSGDRDPHTVNRSDRGR